ncbi:hypothetical protein [Mesorhizobium sp. BH1-1-4]|uniref:hypothetical protein n=1 Tax=Mesorhizobium sp. BH1-1-4 TaxID=2876662 RepID=UPI001CD0D2FE|nr:hypothetical protein [Mesorhizobium sp. BH1-1-4]MBZ9994033.1 hypothetical protein [Mesorhizobium sp. BH1-1-4]
MENLINEIGPLCRSSAGNLDRQIIRPVPGLSSTDTVIVPVCDEAGFTGPKLLDDNQALRTATLRAVDGRPELAVWPAPQTA